MSSFLVYRRAILGLRRPSPRASHHPVASELPVARHWALVALALLLALLAALSKETGITVVSH